MFPSSYDIQLSYKCPKCDGEYWCTKEDAMAGTTFTCCGKTHKISPLARIQIKYYPKERKKVEKLKKEVPQKKKAIETMVAVGYDKTEATNLVKAVYQDGLPVEELVKRAIAKDLK